MTVNQCKIIRFPKIQDSRGCLSFIENGNLLPFIINRYYFIYDTKCGASRGSHAHKSLQQLIIASSGSFDVLLNDGKQKKLITLNRPYFGLYVCPGIWRTLSNFSSGSVCSVLASECYSEEDYIRSFSDFLKFKGIEENEKAN